MWFRCSFVVIGAGILLDTFLVRTVLVPPSLPCWGGRTAAVTTDLAGRALSMKKLLAVTTAPLSVWTSAVPAAADDPDGLRRTVRTILPSTFRPPVPPPQVEGTPRDYGLGGAYVPGFRTTSTYIRMTVQKWFPGLQRQKVDYWAGQVPAATLERACSRHRSAFRARAERSVHRRSVDQGAGNTIETVNRDGPRHRARPVRRGRWSSTPSRPGWPPIPTRPRTSCIPRCTATRSGQRLR